MKSFNDIGIQIPKILIPNSKIDMTKWAVIACDQYTSEINYWKDVEKITENNPSSYHIIFPEVYLDDEKNKELRIAKIQLKMKEYLQNNIFTEINNPIYVEREIEHNGTKKIRKGIILALDLEKYDFSKGSKTLIRATEGTVIERLPPRIKIRQNAELELPHIMVLIDDENNKIIEEFSKQKNKLKKLYDFELMKSGGHIEGYEIENYDNLIESLQNLSNLKNFNKKYKVNEKSTLLFAVGDGNHSLATAKAIWEKKKQKFGLEHNSRYALVEIVNVHDTALEFEPIHRVLFNLNKNIIDEIKKYYNENIKIIKLKTKEHMIHIVKNNTKNKSKKEDDMMIGNLKKDIKDDNENNEKPVQKIGINFNNEYYIIEFLKPSSNLAVGTLQPFLDEFLKNKFSEKIDYVHGDEITINLGNKPNNAGFYLPSMEKKDLFKTVIVDGVLPRKTFSMGHAHEKRYYIEARKIQ